MRAIGFLVNIMPHEITDTVTLEIHTSQRLSLSINKVATHERIMRDYNIIYAEGARAILWSHGGYGKS